MEINDFPSSDPSYSDRVWAMINKMKDGEVFSISKNVVIANRDKFIESIKIYCNSIYKPDNVDIVFSDVAVKKYVKKPKIVPKTIT